MLTTLMTPRVGGREVTLRCEAIQVNTATHTCNSARVLSLIQLAASHPPTPPSARLTSKLLTPLRHSLTHAVQTYMQMTVDWKFYCVFTTLNYGQFRLSLYCAHERSMVLFHVKIVLYEVI